MGSLPPPLLTTTTHTHTSDASTRAPKVSSRSASGLPILVLVNKCDADGAMSVAEVKEVFNESAPKLGVRDCKVLDVSAVTG
jgi:signal recognition particle receptor subunit beta